MKSVAFILVILFLFSGCAIGSRFHAPEMEPPERFREMETAVGSSMADVPWWDVFQDKALQGLIREAVRNNHDLLVAAARVEEARASIGVARADILPQSDLIASAQRDRNSHDIYPNTERLTSTYSGGFSTTWEVDLWGRLRQKISAARAEAEASGEFRRGVMITLVSDTAKAYFLMRQYDLQLQIAQDTLETRQKTVELFKQRQKGGVASGLEVAQAEGDMHETEATIPDFKRLIMIQENTICGLLGRNPGPVERGESLEGQKSIPEVPETGLPSDLLRRRPDVIREEYLVKAANATVGAQVGEFFPKFNLNNFLGGEGRRPTDFWGGDKGYVWTIGGDTALPVFHGGRNVYQYKVAKAQWKQTVELYKQTVVNAFTDVGNSLADIRYYADVRVAQEKEVTADREAAKLSRTRYEGGFSDYLEVLDAERRRFTSENALARTRGNQFIALSQLYRSLGGGWQQEPEKT
jgi:multidrug efflux system outer membrane protein